MQLTNDLRAELVTVLRNQPQPVYSREANLVANTLDADKRRIQWTLTTEDPAMVYDWNSGRVVLEVLLMSGAEYESQTPLLRDHSQYSVTSILGSVTEHSVVKDELLGWLNFGTDLDDTAESIWRRVAQGHLRRGSVGYDYSRNDYVTIPAGETRAVAGRNFTAPKDRDLRVVTRWRLREFSMVVIPADARAIAKEQTAASAVGSPDTRGTDANESAESLTELNAPNATSSQPKRSTEDGMKKFLKFLHAAGLAASITNTEEALNWARSGNLSADQITELGTLCKDDNVDFDPASATAKRAATTGTRGATETTETTEQTDATRTGASPAGIAGSQVDQAAVQRAANEAIQAERNRIASIRALHAEHPGVPAEVVRQAESEGWDLTRTTTAFLTALRDSRQPGVPAIHVGRGRHNLSLAVITAALLGRTDLGLDSGINPDSPVFRSPVINTIGRRREFQAGWMVGVPETGERRNEFEQTFERANQLGLNNLSFMRAAELILELETGERHFDESEILERAFSSGGFSAVFGAVIHMQLLASYAATQSAYAEFCEVVEVGDFREHKDADMGQVGRLKKQSSKSNNGQAAILNVDDPTLVSILVERYAGLLKVTDQTIIHDAFGVVGMLPAELGATCAQMPADLAFAQVLNTANMTDGRARYNTTDGNLISGSVFDEALLTSLGVALTAKKIGDRRINVNGSVLVAGATQGPQVKKQMASQFTTQNEVNPHSGTYRVVQDTAIDLGVADPAQNDLAIAGTPNSIYAFAGGNKRSIAVAFRRGTNRGPVTRSGMLTQGEWGMYWDVFMDVGAAFRRRIGTVKVNIA
jgi:hypothetical protein